MDGDGSPEGTDCDDNDAANYPGNTEICDDADNDCDATTFATGEDTDVDTDSVITCLDCDDADIANFPGNTEVCDDGDNDCDATTFAAGEDTDVDSDGVITCLDCDDADTGNFPGNTEICDGADNDCDGTTFATGEDTDVDTDGFITCLDCDDADGDNFPGNTEVCDGNDNDCLNGADADAAGEVDVDLDSSLSCDDCDDTDGDNFPGNTEVCDGSDNDCNSTADFDAAGEIDFDTDGSLSCADCDDNDTNNTPGGAEVCDGADNDCDVNTVFTGEDTDVDTDGSIACLDCDDGDINNFPGNTEVCDGSDNDCLNGADADTAGEIDFDNDGSLSCDDCDDNDTNNVPGGTEVCDGQDNDCNSAADFDGAGEIDFDSDGSLSCEDCDDNNTNATPGATEACDGFDTNCDGLASSTYQTGAINTPSSGGNRVRGNIFLASEAALVSSFSAELTVSAGAELQWLIYEGTSITGSFTLVAQNTTVVSTTDAGVEMFHSSGGFGYELTPGTYYALATQWTTSAGYGWQSSPAFPIALPWGQHVASMAKDSYPTVPSTITSGNTGNSYSMIVVTDDEGDFDSDSSLACADCDDDDTNNAPGNAEVCDGADNDCSGSVDVSTYFQGPVGGTGPLGPGYVRGGRFLANSDSTLRSVQFYFGGAAGQALNWLVYEGTSASDLTTYTLVSSTSTTLTDATLEWKSSAAIDLPTTAGSYYILAAHWAGTGTMTASNYTYPQTTGPFTYEAEVFNTAVDLTPPTSATGFAFNTGGSDGIGFTVVGEDDIDTDGALACEDCDDLDLTIFPGNVEECDGVDGDCDASTEAGDGETDPDTDGYLNCEDCDDGDINIFPGADEFCDGVDSDCDPATGFSNGAGDWAVTDSTQAGGPAFAPITLGSPTFLTLADDELSGALPIGFTFLFGGEPSTEAYVRSNGAVTFDGDLSTGTYTNDRGHLPLGTVDGTDRFIAVWMADLDPSVSGTITYETIGTSPDQVFVVEWDDVSYYDGGNPSTQRVTAQLQLFETSNRVEIHVTSADTSVSTSGATLGVEGTEPVAVEIYSQDPTATATAMAWRFTPNEEVDSDFDTFLLCEDCDDFDSSAYPGAPALCDGVDNDCDGLVDRQVDTSSPGSSIGPGANTVTTDTITNTVPGTVTDLNVSLDITHTFNGDLVIVLTSPSGTQVQLFDQNGGYQNNVLATLDDEAAAALPSSNTPTTVVGTFQPIGSLADFDGEPSDGVWTLQITDDANGDSGTLNSWSLELEIVEGGTSICSVQDCASLLASDPSALDGAYWLDPLGTGVGAEYECDMTNGGWTELFYNDFDVIGPDAGWSFQATYDCAGDVMLGGYNNIAAGLIEITVDTSGVPHTEARVQTEYWAVDSWDSEQGWIDIDGSNIWSATFTTGSTPNLCGNPGRPTWTENSAFIDLSFPHTAGSLFYSAGSNLNDVVDDESFGVDDVVIWVR